MAKHSIAMATSTGGRDHSPGKRSVNLCDPIIRPVTPKLVEAERRRKHKRLILVSPSVTEAKQRQPVPFPSKETGGTRDADLVARCRAGDVDAFETIYNQHAARLYTLACRMAGSEDGEDLLQEIFLQAHRKLVSFKGDSALGTWLYRLALNHCLDYVRSRRAKMDRLTETLDAETSHQPVARRDTPIGRLDLERALERLP